MSNTGNCCSTTFNLPSPLPSWPPGDGFAKGSVDLGGLEVRQVSTFTKIWSTQEGGQGNLGATFYNPSPVPANFSMLGSYGQPNAAPLFGWVLVGEDIGGTGSLAEPVDYNLVWSSEGLNIKQDGHGYFWLPLAPEGYKPIGLVVTASPEKPSVGEVRCVLSDFTDECEKDSSFLWGSNGFDVYGLRPILRDVRAPGVCVGTFIGNTSDNIPSLSCLKNNRLTTYLSMPNLDQIKTLAMEYGPLIYFHPKEKYLCSSVNFFFSNGALLYSKTNPDRPSPIDLDGSNLPQGGTDDGSFWLDLPNDDRRNKVMAGDLESSEVYLHVKPMLGGTFTDLAFWVFYPFNGPAKARVLVIKSLSLGKIGEHVGDWEHVTLRISNFTGELWRVYFAQHSGGEWKDAPELEFQNGTNKPVAYSSLNGHAFYSEPGLVLQGSKIVGIRNDTAKGNLVDAGKKFNLVAVEYLDCAVAEPLWLNYHRRWGPKVTYNIAKELHKVTRLLPRKLKRALEKALPSELFGEQGPSGPKDKENWTNDEKI